MAGYPKQLFLDVPPDLYTCNLCGNIFNSPRQCPQLHLYCKGCIDAHMDIKRECPKCACPLSKETITSPALLSEIVGSMQIRCPTTLEAGVAAEESEYVAVTSPPACGDASCTWIGTVDTLQEHIDQVCRQATQPCPYDGCKLLLQRHQLPSHDSICDYKQLECNHCAGKIKRLDQQQHVNLCGMKPLSCPLGCGVNVPTRDLAEHLAAVCLQQEVECPNMASPIGCSSVCPGRLLRRDLTAHLTDARTLVAVIAAVGSQGSKQNKVFAEMSATISKMVNQATIDRQDIQDQSTTIVKLKEAVARTVRIATLMQESETEIAAILRRDADTATLIDNWAHRSCPASYKVLKEQLNSCCEVDSESLATHLIAWDCRRTDFKSSTLKSADISLGGGVTACIFVSKITGYILHPYCQIHIAGSLGSDIVQCSVIAFAFGKSPPAQWNDTISAPRKASKQFAFNDAAPASTFFDDGFRLLAILRRKL